MLWGGCDDQRLWHDSPWRGHSETPLKPSFSFAPERIERLKATPEFQEIAASEKESSKERDEEIRYGKSIQDDIVLLLSDMDGSRVYHDRDEFRKLLESVFKGSIRFPPYFWDVMIDTLSEWEK